MSIAMITGSFDPVTIGHIDLIRRAARIFGKVYAAVLINPDKRYVFEMEERLELLRLAVSGISGAEAVAYSGTAVELAKTYGADCFVRGLRDIAEYGYEREMAEYNYIIGGIETVLLPTGGDVADVSSTMVRKMLLSGQSVEKYIPQAAYKSFCRLYNKKTIPK